MTTEMTAMIVTVTLPGGPTVQLDYDPARADAQGKPGGRTIVWPCTSIKIVDQACATDVADVQDIVIAAAAFLMCYAMDAPHWAADIRPTGQAESHGP